MRTVFHPYDSTELESGQTTTCSPTFDKLRQYIVVRVRIDTSRVLATSEYGAITQARQKDESCWENDDENYEAVSVYCEICAAEVEAERFDEDLCTRCALSQATIEGAAGPCDKQKP